MATRTRIFSFVLMMMMSFTVLLSSCSAKVYKVGDSEGWTAKDDISGDLEFITCDPTSPVAVHKTGHDLVRLTEPGVHYFITSQSGYCEAGLKLRVMVKPEPKAVTYPNFPKKVDLSAMERLNNWLKTFKHPPHH
ncbi:BnaA09g39310D [Brassica napus]|uniref:BnaA09g39310D protein n=1 Tax=Brassica napus TaxID=3708 RepID=A0A078FAD2_BRANA|nr:BnaA09g39310D [Brassica napus]